MENAPRRLPFLGEMVDSAVPKHVFDFRRSRRGFEDRANKAGMEEREAWREVIQELYDRGVWYCKQMVDGGVELLVSEKGDEERLLDVLGKMERDQSRKCKVVLRV